MKNIIQIVKNIHHSFLKYVFIGLVFLMPQSCVEKEDFDTFDMEGFIVGFDPCTVRSKIGYVIISKDFVDTVTTYSLSPSENRMPAPVGLDPNRPLYTIPEQEFRYFRSSAYFPEFLYYPDSLIINYPVRIAYRKALEEERIVNFCSTDINTSDFWRQWGNNQVIVVKAFKN